MDTADTQKLIKLSDTDETIAHPDEDIRGREVKDKEGEDIGKVRDLLIDQTERKVRLIEVASGGFLGIGKDTTFIPVDAITGITDDEVRLQQARKDVASAPDYDPELVHERDTYAGIFDYYGYGGYWAPRYVYPAYPYYGRI
ncbi:MAG: PRC-barrel domain-containing protein [Leucobacter sp.]